MSIKQKWGKKSLFSFQKIPLIQIDCKTIRIFSSTREPSNKTLGGGWKRRARLGRDARPMGVWSSRASTRETLKVDFTRRYDICLRLSCASSNRHDFTRTLRVVWIRPTAFVRHIVNMVSENCARVDGPKSWRMLVAHDSRKQKSYRLNRPLDNQVIVTMYLVLFLSHQGIWAMNCARLLKIKNKLKISCFYK